MQLRKTLCVLLFTVIFVVSLLTVNAQYESVTATFDYTAASDATAAVTVDISQNTETAVLVRNIDFEAPNIPKGTTLKWNTNDAYGSVNGGVLSISAKTTATLVDNIYGDYTAVFHIRTASRTADRIFLQIRKGYFLELRGTSTNHGATDNSGNTVSYAAAISTGNVQDSGGLGMYDVTDLKSAYPTTGYWVRFEVTGRTINIWLVANKNWTGEFTGKPNLTYTAQTDFETTSALNWYSENGGGVYIDDLKLECETFTYQNNYDLQAYNPSKAVLSTDETTGNTVYMRGVLENNGDYSKETLFTAPENYEMRFWLLAGDSAKNQFRIYLKNDINIRVMGNSVTGTDNREIRLCNGNEIIKTHIVAAENDIPFTAGYIKVIFRGEQLRVYISDNADFENSNIIFEHTFDGLTTTDSTIGIYGDNTAVCFDNFKVYDLGTADMKYKQIILSGTDIKLFDVSGGTSVEIGSHILPHIDGVYRISVANTNGCLTVYVNGVTALETTSSAATQILFDGTGAPLFTFDAATPAVIGAGDLDYNQKVDANDLIIMKKILLGLDKATYVTEAVNADGDTELKTDIRDLIRIKKIIADTDLL